MIQVDEKLTRKAAGLARLSLTDEEVRVFSAQLKEVVGYFEQLEEVSQESFSPESSLPLGEAPTAFRQDVVREFPSGLDGKPAMLAQAPEQEKGGFKVPQVL